MSNSSSTPTFDIVHVAHPQGKPSVTWRLSDRNPIKDLLCSMQMPPHARPEMEDYLASAEFRGLMIQAHPEAHQDNLRVVDSHWCSGTTYHQLVVGPVEATLFSHRIHAIISRFNGGTSTCFRSWSEWQAAQPSTSAMEA